MAAATWGVAGGIVLKMLLDGQLRALEKRALDIEIKEKEKELEELKKCREPEE
jgi:hypothetical protein